MIKVSIIVPVFNTEKYLNKCINSLLNQTLKDIEIIIINDGSTDNSEKIIKEFNDERIKYIPQENQGIGKTRNKGIKLAKGKYIVFVDSDDYIATTFCEKLYQKAEKEHLDIVFCDYFEDKGYLKEIRFPNISPASSLKDNPQIVNKINLGPCNKIYLRELLLKNDIFFVENLKYEDAPFVIKSLIYASKIGKINECLTYYVIHENSETTKRNQKIRDILKICEIIIAEMSKYDYLRPPLTNLIVMILCDYTVQQRYINNRKFRNAFINDAFKILNDLDSNWRECDYLKRCEYLVRKVKSSKFLTKIYCTIYNHKNKQ